MIAPHLHHASAFRQMLGVNAGGRHRIAFGVCHLALYNVPPEAEFTQSCSRQPAKPVPRHSRLVAHAIERMAMSTAICLRASSRLFRAVAGVTAG